MRRIIMCVLLLLLFVMVPRVPAVKDGSGGDAGDSRYSAMEINIPGTYYGDLTDLDDEVDMYKCVVHENFLTVTVEYPDGSLSLKIYNAYGDLLSEDTGESPLDASVDTTPGDVIYIKITLVSGDTVSYELEVDEMTNEEITLYAGIAILVSILCISAIVCVIVKIIRGRASKEETLPSTSTSTLPTSQEVMSPKEEIIRTKVLIVCPYCGAKVPEGTTKCPNCGAPL